jgi:hypothetical protein
LVLNLVVMLTLAPRRPGATARLTGTFTQKRVTEGMPNPTPPYSGPMLPMGGAQLTPQQLQSVSAYVYSVSLKGG